MVVGGGPAVRELPEELRRAGFRIRNDFVSEDEEADLLREVDSRRWETQLSRRTQHYGWRFEYTSKSCFPVDSAIPPAFVDLVLDRLRSAPDVEIDWLSASLEDVQCTVNEYHPGQGIAPHVDTHAAFGDGILALSLGSGAAVRLARRDRPNVYQVWLERRSLITYVGEARYAYTHGIVSRKGDLLDGAWVFRGRRVSLTFRSLPSQRAPCPDCELELERGGEKTFRPYYRCRCDFPDMCDARPNGAPRLLPTRIGAAAPPGANTSLA